jgi:hypothetical protein
MSRIVFVTWDGGGNLAPALAIARELARRGHRAAFLGEATQRPPTEAAGQAFTGFTPRPQPAAPPATAAERQHQLMAGTWLNMSLADDLVTMLAREPADAVVIDCMLAGVLARSAEFGTPTAVLVPGLYHSVLPVRDAMLAAGLELLAQPGVPAPEPRHDEVGEQGPRAGHHPARTRRGNGRPGADPPARAPNCDGTGGVVTFPQAPRVRPRSLPGLRLGVRLGRGRAGLAG